jgi:hypothetical protein
VDAPFQAKLLAVRLERAAVSSAADHHSVKY